MKSSRRIESLLKFTYSNPYSQWYLFFYPSCLCILQTTRYLTYWDPSIVKKGSFRIRETQAFGGAVSRDRKQPLPDPLSTLALFPPYLLKRKVYALQIHRKSFSNSRNWRNSHPRKKGLVSLHRWSVFSTWLVGHPGVFFHLTKALLITPTW